MPPGGVHPIAYGDAVGVWLHHESRGKVYKYCKLRNVLRDVGETCSENCVERLASWADIF